MVELTERTLRELFRAGVSKNGGWSNAQMACLGVTKGDMALPGWRERLIGTEISEANARQFVALKDVHLKQKERRQEEHKEKQEQKARKKIQSEPPWYNPQPITQPAKPTTPEKVFILTNAKGNTIIDAYTTFQKAEDARADLLKKRPGEDYNVWGCKVF